jgi:hypothetical protein
VAETINDRKVLERIVWDDADGYELVEETITGQSRWRTDIQTVFRRLSDNKLFITYWGRGSTENCDHDQPDEAVEARSRTKLVTEYVPV